jgi:hypothetical protein
MNPRELIFGMLSRKVDLRALPWLEKTASMWGQEPEDGLIFSSFSAAVRHAGKAPLAPGRAELELASELVPGWDPSDWTLDQAARIFLLLALPPGDESAQRIDALYRTADVGEALALLKALPLLPDPGSHLALAKSGARSNVKSQFEAIALRNPYPKDHFDELAWNQMITKAVFIDTPLPGIQALFDRRNPALSRMLTDLTHERRAAGRSINPLVARLIEPTTNAAPEPIARPHAV